MPLGTDAKARAEAHVEAAERFALAERFDLAEPQCRLALAADPLNASATSLLASCLSQRGALAEARRLGEEAIRLAPDNAHMYVSFAGVLLGSGRYAQAERVIETALRLDPENVTCFQVLSAIHIVHFRHQAALDAAARGLKIDPHHVGLLTSRARALMRLRRITEAALLAKEVLRLDPGAAEAHAILGQKHRFEGETRAAAAVLRESVRLNPSDDGHVSEYENVMKHLARETEEPSLEMPQIFKTSYGATFWWQGLPPLRKAIVLGTTELLAFVQPMAWLWFALLVGFWMVVPVFPHVIRRWSPPWIQTTGVALMTAAPFVGIPVVAVALPVILGPHALLDDVAGLLLIGPLAVAASRIGWARIVATAWAAALVVLATFLVAPGPDAQNLWGLGLCWAVLVYAAARAPWLADLIEARIDAPRLNARLGTSTTRSSDLAGG